MSATTQTWEIDGYVASLTASSEHTRDAYARDIRQFVADTIPRQPRAP